MLRHQQKERYLTIQRRSRIIRCRGYVYYVPEIRLCGLWLVEQGFFPKNKVKITVRRDVLVIQPIEETEYQYANKKY